MSTFRSTGGTLTLSADESDRVFAAIYPALRRFAAVVAPVEVDPDDLVQDALANTLARHPLLDLDDPASYLRVAIVRLASNERRRLGRARRALGRAATAPTAELQSYPSDVDLDALRPEDRALLYATIIEGTPIHEAAALLGISAPLARVRKRRALGRLRLTHGDDND